MMPFSTSYNTHHSQHHHSSPEKQRIHIDRQAQHLSSAYKNISTNHRMQHNFMANFHPLSNALMNINNLYDGVFMNTNKQLNNLTPVKSTNDQILNYSYLSPTQTSPIAKSFSIEAILGLASHNKATNLSIKGDYAFTETYNRNKYRKLPNDEGQRKITVSPDSTAKDYRRDFTSIENMKNGFSYGNNEERKFSYPSLYVTSSQHQLGHKRSRNDRQEDMKMSKSSKIKRQLNLQQSKHKIDEIRLEERREEEEDFDDEMEEEKITAISNQQHQQTNNEQQTCKAKRVRTIFTPEQLERLESEFERQQYMVGPERLYLAAALSLSEAQVKVWFQNRRIKWRKQHLEIQQAKIARLRSNENTDLESIESELDNHSDTNNL